MRLVPFRPPQGTAVEQAINLAGDRPTPKRQNAAECQVCLAVVVAVATQVSFPEVSELPAILRIAGTFQDFAVRCPFTYLVLGQGLGSVGRRLREEA